MKRSQDHYARKARIQGYPARSIYKLQEIQDRFHPVHPGATVLDLGAAPGSWTQLLARVVGDRGRVIAVDLSPITVSGRCIEMITTDIFSDELELILEARGPFHAVLSDAAPATTGNRSVDTSRSAALAERALYLAGNLLCPGGNVVVKIFQGGNEKSLLDLMRTQYRTARTFKPKACRSESFETYLVGLDHFAGRTGTQ